jgi:nitrate/TMAO reductase-like tetraheme cytochrome c subunit
MPGFLRRIPHPSLRSRRGLLVLFLLIAAFGASSAVVGVVAIQWTETADFCGRCHTMGPELKAYAMGPHRDVACAECHVEPGLVGWVKAKVNGTRQLVDLLLGQYPTPIPPPAHANLPPVSMTCRRCHQIEDLVENGGPVRIILRPRYEPDEENTREMVALVLRPVGLGQESSVRGVHWHVDEDVQFVSADERNQKIDWVGVIHKDGTRADYVAGSEVSISTDAQRDVDRLKASEPERRMDCIDCHNRIGHNIPSLDRAVDDAMSLGLVDSNLPYVKKEAISRLSVDYASAEDADAALAALRDYYATKYPLVLQGRAASIESSIKELQRIYRLVATPDMRVTAATYPSNLGHRSAPGCFRCHDGNHFKVIDGALTNQTIPSTCGTCHTFPQIGTGSGSIDLGNGSGILLVGAKPANHDETRWVFTHKLAVASTDPSGSSCSACHNPQSCKNCHTSTTMQVPHDNITFAHPKLIANVGAAACAFCHRPVFCERCHAPGSLPSPFPKLTPGPSP